MKHRSSCVFSAACVALLAAATTSAPAFAHGGHAESGLMAGLFHPMTGVDHLLATLGLGLLAGCMALRGDRPRAPHVGGPHTPQVGGLRSGAPPALGMAAVVGLLLGALLAVLPGTAAIDARAAGGSGTVELAAAVSLLVVAALLLGAERLAIAPVAALALVIGLPHGYLHALEGAGAGFFAGLALGSVLLFGAGLAAGGLLGAVPDRTRGAARRLLAAAFAACSAGLLAMAA